MRSRVVPALWFLLSASALFACSASSSSATQIVVTVDSDLAVPNEVDRVTIGVGGDASAPTASADLEMHNFPRTVGLVHEQGGFRPILVKATGWLGSTRVIEKEVKVAFVRGETVRVLIRLDHACAGIFCDDGKTCIEGACEGIPNAGGDSDGGATSGASDASMVGEAGAGDAAASDGGGRPDASTAGQDAGPTDGGTPVVDAGPAGMPPECTIDLPVTGDTYERQTPFALSGTCTDPESGAITKGLTWSDGDAVISRAGTANVMLSATGAHELTFCAEDPIDATQKGCASVTVQVATGTQPDVAITSKKQNDSSDEPFETGTPVVLTGTGSGAGVMLTWQDSLQGSLGSGSPVSLALPIAGKHTVKLTGTDRNQDKATDEESYVVLEAGHTALVEGFDSVNSTLAGTGNAKVQTLAADSAVRVYGGSASGGVYRFTGDSLISSATELVSQPPLGGLVQDIFLDQAHARAYFATAGGLTVCGYDSDSGVNDNCTNFTSNSGGGSGNNNFTSVVRMQVGDNGYLLVGTGNGLLIADSLNGSAQGDTAMDGRKVRAIAVAGSLAWVVADEGLYSYAPAGDDTVHVTGNGAPATSMSSVAVGSGGMIWVGTANGLGRFDTAEERWTTWRVAAGLVSNAITTIAIHRATINGTARDVIWVGTSSGISRFDPSLNAFTSITTADGLPSNSVRDIVVLSDGTKLIATDAGVVRYSGL